MFAYLLMSGSVFVNIEEKNKEEAEKTFVRTAAVLQRGSLFGVCTHHHGCTVVACERYTVRSPVGL